MKLPRVECYLPSVVFGVALLASQTVLAQCPRGQVLVDEDDRNWYCASPASPSDIETVMDRAEQELGEEWQYRKRLIDAIRSLKGKRYKFGAKFDVTSEGHVGRNKYDAIDCSGTVAYGQLSACVVTGFCRAAFPKLKEGLLGENSNAAGIASLYWRQGAFIDRSYSVSPAPGDLIFFKDDGTGPRHGITHVALFLGRHDDGRIVVLHARGGKAQRVLFENLAGDDPLVARIVGYGNTSRLVKKLALIE